jgi:5-hydroxyisourate hydrolase
MGKLTTHILDTMHGVPAGGVEIVLEVGGEVCVRTKSNRDGRCEGPLLEGKDFAEGRYRLIFGVGTYYRGMGLDLGGIHFLEDVVIDFGVSDGDGHYHVPLLVSPYGYSTYRGS